MIKDQHKVQLQVYVDGEESSAVTAEASGSTKVTSADTSSPIYIGALPEGM